MCLRPLALGLLWSVLGCRGGSDTDSGATSDDPSLDSETADASNSDTVADSDTFEPPPDSDTSVTPDSDEGTDSDSGSDPIDPSAPDYAAAQVRSGTRLLPVATHDALGNPILLWFEDTLLDVRCTVRRAGDGAMRCLPESAITGSEASLTEDRYADAECTTPVAQIASICTETGFVTEGDAVYSRDGALGDVYAWMDDTCSVAAASPGWEAAAVDEVDPSEFVQFTQSHLPITAALGAAIWEGEDGSRFASGQAWGIAAAQPVRAFAGRAVPYTHAVTGPNPAYPGGGDLVKSACDAATYDAYVAADPGYLPAWVQVAVCVPAAGGGCTFTAQLRPVVASQNSFCMDGVVLSAGDGERVFRIGSDTSAYLDASSAVLSEYPSLTQILDAGAGPRFLHLASEGTRITPAYAAGAVQVFDGGAWRGLGVWDGIVRLLPEWSIGSVALYTDASCTTPAVEASIYEEGYAFAEDRSSPCAYLPGAPARYEGLWFVPFDTAPSSRSLWTRDGLDCVAYGSVSALTLYDAGAELADALPAARMGVYALAEEE